PEDVEAAVDRAESMVFEVAERRITDSLKPLRELLSDSLDRLEALYGRGESITGVPTGYADLDERLSGLQPSALMIVGSRPAMGKALAVETPVPTPEGWTTMGELTVGDWVFDDAGRPCRVTYTSPVFVGRTCYRVEFDDGSQLVADAEHQWLAYDFPAWKSARERHRHAMRCEPARSSLARDQSHRWKLPRVVTTEQILEGGLSAGGGSRPNWYIRLAGPLDLPECDLPVDPYVLGSWLGDGSSSGSQFTIGERDVDHFRLGGAKKHIPAQFLRASFKQRLSLLQGIMDTDGHASTQGTVELSLADQALCEQVRELVCSLGHKPGQLKRKQIALLDGRETVAWRLRWMPLDPVFRMSRKADRAATTGSHRRFGRSTRRSVRAVTPVKSVPTRCITVDSSSHLYLAGRSMVPTHNTSFALGIAAHASMEARVPVLLFSLEMSHSEITQRLLVSEARVEATRIRNGRLLESDWPKISRAIGRLGEAPLYIDDNPNLTLMEVRAKARRLKAKQGGLGLIIIDYLQLMTGRHTAESRQFEVSEISRGLKILARELEVPVVALSQLSRNLEMRSDKRPVLADLRESGSLEQDADVVLFLYRDEIYNPESADRGVAEVIVSKHRNGPTGKTQLAFLDHFTRFANMAKV
ncbi:MAG: replicative DNA helicase, partial [Acidimicrobiales bacterium]